MGTIFLDSAANHYDATQVLMKYSADFSGWTRTASGRTGTYCLVSPGSTAGFPSFTNDTLYLNLTANYARICVGAAFKISGNQNGFLGTGATIPLFAFGANSNTQVSVMAGIDGSFLAFATYSNSPTATRLGRSSPNIFRPNTWQYIEADVTFNSATGSVTIYHNGTAVLTITGVNTSPNLDGGGLPLNYANQIGLMDFKPGGTKYVADIYFSQAVGHYGDVSVETCFPTGAGANTQWTPSAGANWQCVSEIVPDGDTSYVEDSTVGDRDTYAMGNLSGGITSVVCAQNIINARKTDSGGRQIASVIRSGGANFDGTGQATSSAYLFYWQDYDTDPNTAAAWTVANINAVEAGEKVIA